MPVSFVLNPQVGAGDGNLGGSGLQPLVKIISEAYKGMILQKGGKLWF
jgi:hypothetical protein